MTAVLLREPFRAMGTDCAVVATAEPGELDAVRRALSAARDEVAACERALSRFDAGSDLSRLNRAGGVWVTVDVRLVRALAAAARARDETDGRFDPTILPALVAAGYDSSFERLVPREASPLDGWRAGAAIELDESRLRARVESGAAVDLGGIGKGFAVGRALASMRAAWPPLRGALVDLGGDVGVDGAPPEGGAWRIDVADPRTPGAIAATLELTGGGVATSGRDTRRFGPGQRLHHLIDPVTGAPAGPGPLAVTVVASSTTEAEGHATALGITAVEEADAYLSTRPQLSALVVPHVGRPLELGRLPLRRPREARFLITPQTGRIAWS